MEETLAEETPVEEAQIGEELDKESLVDETFVEEDLGKQLIVEEALVDEASETENLESLDETLGSNDDTLSRCSSREHNKV